MEIFEQHVHNLLPLYFYRLIPAWAILHVQFVQVSLIHFIGSKRFSFREHFLNSAPVLRSSALLNTRVVYCRDNLEKLAKRSHKVITP
jgi:hypothetical protein